jgi:hypothetical protein
MDEWMGVISDVHGRAGMSKARAVDALLEVAVVTWIDDEGGEHTVAWSDYDAAELGGDPRPLLATVLDAYQWAATQSTEQEPS